jgi:hypothetical protein
MAGHQRTADTPAGGGRADGRTPRWAADRGGAILRMGIHAYAMGKGGCGGSPDVEAGKTYQHRFYYSFSFRARVHGFTDRPFPNNFPWVAAVFKLIGGV